jgi:hypothetical protein
MHLKSIALLAAPLLLQAQVPAVQLAVDASLPVEWTTIRGVRELRDGRVIVVDARDQAVKLADFKSGTATMIGRKGSGPGEYQLPLDVFPLPADSSVILDMANNGAPMVITPDGKAGDPMPGMRDGRASGFLNTGAVVDASGRIYRRGFGSTIGRDPIERLDRGKGKVDTVGWFDSRIISPLVQLQEPGGARPMAVRAGKPTPFTSARLFTVTTDGKVVLLSPDPYRVSFIADGKQTDGPVIPFTRLRVTDADKAEWRAERTRPVASIMYNRGGGTTAGYTQPRPVEEPDAWPDVLPPYTIGNTSGQRVHVAPNGMIWIERAVNAGTPALYDVLTPAGALAYRVTLPKRTHIVGFGANGIYAVRLDDDDLEYLQRLRFPAMNNR